MFSLIVLFFLAMFVFEMIWGTKFGIGKTKVTPVTPDFIFFFF